MQITFHNLEDFNETPDYLPLYFRPDYLRSQQKANLLIAQGFSPKSQVTGIFCLDKALAKSLIMSPFGSFCFQQQMIKKDFQEFYSKLEQELINRGVTKIEINHPANIYSDFVPVNWLQHMGFNIDYQDLNQHNILNDEVGIHLMQKRNLRKLMQADFHVTEVKHDDFGQLHDFIAKARKFQGLEINIEKKRLIALVKALPNHYHGWAVVKNNEWAAAVVISIANDDVVYYYLPATNSQYKTDSPMVLLVDFLINHYKNIGFKFLDLGVSSVHGKKQEGLFKFKERMGAVVLPKFTLSKYL